MAGGPGRSPTSAGFAAFGNASLPKWQSRPGRRQTRSVIFGGAARLGGERGKGGAQEGLPHLRLRHLCRLSRCHVRNVSAAAIATRTTPRPPRQTSAYGPLHHFIINETEMTTETNDSQSPEPNRKPRIQLGDGFTVAQEFYDLVLQWAESGLEHLSPIRVYTARHLTGTSRWDALSNCDRRIAGRCIAHMVGRSLLSLTVVKGRHEYPMRYRRS